MTEETWEDEFSSNCVVSLVLASGCFGVTVYCETANQINSDTIPCNSEDLPELFNTIKFHFNPSLFIVHPNIVEKASLLAMILKSKEGIPEHYAYKVEKRSSWDSESAVKLLTSRFKIKSKTQNIANCSYLNTIRQESSVNLNNTPSLQSLHVMLLHLINNIYSLAAANETITINAIEPFQFSKYMRLDANTYHSLQVYHEECHPNVVKGNGRNKEGYSLYSLFDRTKSIPGRLLLKSWMQQPLCNKIDILNRQDGIQVMIRQDNLDFVDYLEKLMKNISRLPYLVMRLKRVAATVPEWDKLYRSIDNGIKIIAALEQFNEQDRNTVDKEYLWALLNNYQLNSVRQVFDKMETVIDFPSSFASGVMHVKSGYDSNLDQLREVYENIEGMLTSLARDILNEIPLLSSLSVQYIPQIGYLIAIHVDEKEFIETNYSDFNYIFQQGEYNYYKNAKMRELDDSIGDIKSTILDTQKAIMLEVEDIVLDIEAELHEMNYIVATLDVINSLGAVAVENNFVRPEISEDEHLIVIKNGKHPLQAMTTMSTTGLAFVPNDTYLTDEKHVAIITGANGCGKSVYMKQVGLLVFLAHIGSFLPCEKAIIGITDRILTRIESVETVSTHQSAFSLDANQICYMLSRCTPRSLCLIDEFGKGTSPVDGIALMGSVIRYLIHHRPAKVICTLHFTEILHEQILSQEMREQSINIFKMDSIIDSSNPIHINSSSGSTGRKLVLHIPTPLYKLKMGSAESSEGIACAHASGLTSSIIERALHIKECTMKGIPLQPKQDNQRIVFERKQTMHALDENHQETNILCERLSELRAQLSLSSGISRTSEGQL